jgi:putative acyl-CoA dehydrogenase
VIERLALALAAATLMKHAPAPVADAFVAQRLRERSVTFGASAAKVDEDVLLGRLALRA